MVINRELSILMIGRLLQVVIALVIIKIATKLLDASEMGNLYLIANITGFFSLFLINPIGQYINRRTHQWYDESNLLNALFLYNLYVFFIALFSIVIVNFLYYFNVGNSIDLFHLSIFVAAFVYFNTWNQTIIPIINMLEKRIIFVLFTLFSQVLFLSLAYLFIRIFEVKAIFWFLGQSLALGGVAFIAFIYFIKKIQNNFSYSVVCGMVKIDNFKNIIKFSFPLSIGVFFLWMQTQSYGIIIEKYIGSEFLGFFGVGLAVATAISSSFESLVMQYIYPKMYKSMKDEKQFSDIISSTLNLIIPIYFLLAIFISFFAVFFVAILVDIKFYYSYIYTIFGAWTAFFIMSSNMMSNIAHARLKTKELVYSYAIGGVVTIVCLLGAVNSENYRWYVPLSLVLASILGFWVMFLRMNRIVKVKLKSENFYLVLFYSIPFTTSAFFYSHSKNFFYSICIAAVFGIYFLYILSILIKKGEAID
ncbi:lipopolysaccharide biosynthesis protein [Vibrio aestuarianus]|uniref:Oligosaccharide flippase family protein n=1 Tax=Vibrio aestuarianus TaxID=28171 RepID=A0ABD7YK82_9VIBR|nr:oligosaccharide flippase family protein [Vibrio aestuarianus]WGK85209.1 oligosaccharide flippase family protein [Vibrio aestuarianus]CAH8222907.1 Polysaccharide biosynthesis protein [Vibrio aestuarianus]